MSTIFELTDGDPQIEVKVDPQKDWIENFQAELDAYYRKLNKLNSMEPVTAFQTLSALSARVSEIRSQLMRVDSNRSTAFRNRQIDPFLEELDRQFKIHSRVQSIRDLEFRLSGVGF